MFINNFVERFTLNCIYFFCGFLTFSIYIIYIGSLQDKKLCTVANPVYGLLNRENIEYKVWQLPPPLYPPLPTSPFLSPPK